MRSFIVVKVDPKFAYAFTLLGHEYVAIEELEKALACFQSAVRLEPRHYNAWYGIGLVYYKQERFQLASTYYRRALAINRLNPVLMCHVAVVRPFLILLFGHISLQCFIRRCNTP